MMSVDGIPVRGAYPLAVGPNSGPPPQFVFPSPSETAATPRLVTARWVAFLSLMAAIGLFILRIVVARPVVARVPGTRLRSVTIAFGVASSIALLAIPVYLLLSTAEVAHRSLWIFRVLFPPLRLPPLGV